MFNVSALLLDDALKPATPMTNGTINETLRQFAPLNDDRLIQLLDCRESSTLIDHLLKGTPDSVIDWIQVRAVWRPHFRRLSEVKHPTLIVTKFFTNKQNFRKTLTKRQ